MMMQPPFPWFGGKSRVSGLVWERLGNVPNYVEPFFGSGAVLLNRPHDPGTETVNDIDGYVANFWRALQADPEAVAQWCDWPVNECVPAGTMIATPSGEVCIEDICSGMTVLGEKDGQVVETKVIATKKDRASEFYSIGSLRLTGNHPVWTSERGYVEARQLRDRMHVKSLYWPTCKTDLVMLQYEYEEKQAMGNLYLERPPDERGALCWRDISWEKALQRAYVSCCAGRKDASRLLDSLFDCRWHKTIIQSNRCRDGRWMAGGRAPMDCSLSNIDKFDKSNRGRGRGAGLCADPGVAAEVVTDAKRRFLSARPCISYEGQKTHARSDCQDKSVQYGPSIVRQCQAEVIRLSQATSNSPKADGEDDCQQLCYAANPGIQNSSSGGAFSSMQEGRLCRDRRSFPFNKGGGRGGGGKKRRDPIRPQAKYSMQRLHVQTPITVYNLQTGVGNYFANRILVHNCDLHARHNWLLDQATFREQMHTDPDFYDAKIAAGGCGACANGLAPAGAMSGSITAGNGNSAPT